MTTPAGSTEPDGPPASEDPAGSDGKGRRETELERLDRNYGELLQELRVAQTGVQILFAFLLTVAFTPAFAATSPLQRGVYFTSLLLSVAATAFLVAPVSHHRLVFRLRLKGDLVRAANLEAGIGLALLALALVCTVLLVTDVLFDGWPVPTTAAATGLLFLVLWLALPLADRRRGRSTGRT